MRLSVWVDRYCLADLALSRAGAEQLRVAVRRLESWYGEPLHVEHLSVEVVAGWLRAMLDSGVAAATVNSKRRAILTLWRSAHEAGLAPPVGTIRPAREPQRIPDSWTLEQVGQLLSYARSLGGTVAGLPMGLYFYSLLLALYDTGERVTAVRSCRTDDFDRTLSTILIRPESQKCRRERLCSVSPETAEAIASLLHAALPRRLLWPWVASRRHFFRTLRAVIEGAGLPASKQGMGLSHRLRRTSGTLVQANGGIGWLHLGNTERVFRTHYLDPRVAGNGQLDRLPRPRI